MSELDISKQETFVIDHPENCGLGLGNLACRYLIKTSEGIYICVTNSPELRASIDEEVVVGHAEHVGMPERPIPKCRKDIHKAAVDQIYRDYDSTPAADLARHTLRCMFGLTI